MGMEKPIPTGFLDEAAWLAPLKSVQDPRLNHLAGRKELRALQEILSALVRSPPHGNRRLEAYHVLILHLLGFYNPMLRSLRTHELASQHPAVRARVGLDRVCRSTHSDFLKVADPALLLPLVRALREKIPVAARRAAPDLEALLERVVAFDGSYFSVPVTVAWAMHTRYPAAQATAGKAGHKRSDRPLRKHLAQVRLNLHWATRRGVPEGLSLDGATGSEAEALRRHLEPDTIYVLDRGVVSFQGLRAIQEHDSNFVGRLKANVGFRAESVRALTAEDAAQGVVSDRVGYFTGPPMAQARQMPVREVVMVRPQCPERPIRLVTDLFDPPAPIIGGLYENRWSVEIFFRWLKVHGHFAHLVTHSREGTHFVFYVMLIALALHSLIRGRPASKYDILYYQLSLQGGGGDPLFAAGLARLERERELARQRYARKKAQKKLA